MDRKDSSLWHRSSVIEALGGREFEEKLIESIQYNEQVGVQDKEWTEKIVNPRVLTFRQKLDEKVFIHIYSRLLARRFLGPLFILCLYSVYSITEHMWMFSLSPQEEEKHDRDMSHPAVQAFNITWGIIAIWSLGMAFICIFHWKGCHRETRAVEYAIAGGLCILFWPGVFLGNRWRCSQVFGADVIEVFGAYTSDAELLLLLDCVVSYFVIFTPIRLIANLALVISMSTGFIVSTAICGSSPKGDSIASVAVAIMLFILALMEQKITENFKRQHFYRIYRAQRDNIAVMTQAANTHKSIADGSAALGNSGDSSASASISASQNRGTLMVSAGIVASRARTKTVGKKTVGVS